jgi:hypothetical protein
MIYVFKSLKKIKHQSVTYWLNLPISRNYDYRVSEWLLFNVNSAIFQLHVHHGKDKLIFFFFPFKIFIENFTFVSEKT